MERLITIANQYVKESDWKLITMLKMCLLSLGVMIGISLPRKHKNMVFAICVPVFFVTYVPMLVKLIKLIKEVKTS